MANDFMKNANKVVLNGEEVSFNNLAEPILVAEETEVKIEKKPSKKAKKEEKVEKPTVEETVVEEVAETTEDTVVEETPTDEE